ncbi:MAG: hypothetical protein ACR2RD_11785, partial [Woeseiaceae bacterium]
RTANAALKDDNANPAFRPILRISIVAGIVVAAMAITIIDNGSVAKALFVANVEPIIPPSVTMTIEPVVEINWQVTSKLRFRACIAKFDEE